MSESHTSDFNVEFSLYICNHVMSYIVSKIMINISIFHLGLYIHGVCVSVGIALAHATHSGPLASQWYCTCGHDPTVEGECECVLPVVIDRLGSNIMAGRPLMGRVNGGHSDYVTATRAELIVVLLLKSSSAPSLCCYGSEKLCRVAKLA